MPRPGGCTFVRWLIHGREELALLGAHAAAAQTRFEETSRGLEPPDRVGKLDKLSFGDAPPRCREGSLGPGPLEDRPRLSEGEPGVLGHPDSRRRTSADGSYVRQP
jgi:hypothetical protein